jgi:hypothetical protein
MHPLHEPGLEHASRLDHAIGPLCCKQVAQAHVSPQEQKPRYPAGNSGESSSSCKSGKDEGGNVLLENEWPELSLDHAIRSVDRCIAGPFSERLSACPSSEE